jgi:phasin
MITRKDRLARSIAARRSAPAGPGFVAGDAGGLGPRDPFKARRRLVSKSGNTPSMSRKHLRSTRLFGSKLVPPTINRRGLATLADGRGPRVTVCIFFDRQYCIAAFGSHIRDRAGSANSQKPRTGAKGVAFGKIDRLMDMNAKSAPTKSASSTKIDAPRAFREMAEKGTTQAKETYGKMSAAGTEAAEVIKTSYSIAVRGAHEYNDKFIEFAQANIDAAFGFFEKLSGMKSPSAFLELSSEHARKQFETLSEQTKQLVAIAQKVTLASAEPLKTSAAKAFNHAA